MKRTIQSSASEVAERQTLRRRIKRFYDWFNHSNWANCYALIDPALTEQGKVNRADYVELMEAFKDAYGSVNLWHTRLSLHLKTSPKQRDSRPFAYVYIVWQDGAHAFHMFRERWIKHEGQWFTRVVGLVPNNAAAGSELN